MQSQNSFRQKDASESARYGMVIDQLLSITASLLRKGPQEIDIRMPFIEMGADSIGLALIRQIRTRFGVDVSIQRIFEDDNSVQTLASYIERTLPPERPSSSAQADSHREPT